VQPEITLIKQSPSSEDCITNTELKRLRREPVKVIAQHNQICDCNRKHPAESGATRFSDGVNGTAVMRDRILSRGSWFLVGHVDSTQM